MQPLVDILGIGGDRVFLGFAPEDRIPRELADHLERIAAEVEEQILEGIGREDLLAPTRATTRSIGAGRLAGAGRVCTAFPMGRGSRAAPPPPAANPNKTRARARALAVKGTGRLLGMGRTPFSQR